MGRSKPYTLTVPLDEEKVGKLDQMLDVLYQEKQTVQTQLTALPLSNVANASAISVLVGRGSAAGLGPYQEIALGTGLLMTGTTLSASATSGSPAQILARIWLRN